MKLNEYIHYDGLGLAQLIEKKEVQPIELLELALQRSDQVNPKLNAIIIPMHEYAKNRAKQQLTGAFAGVPFLVKDLFQEYAGIPTSYGCNALKSRQYTPETNAEIVNRWEKAGIVTFGRTNTPEFGIKGITEPDAWGSCSNPWHLKHNSGGSSGGSASAVAAGIVPIAGAGDGGGSIRIPASYCGLFGLKPSRGRTPWGPQMSEGMHGAVIQHVLTKSVRDSAAMLDATHGFENSSLFKIEKPERPFLENLIRPPQQLKIAFNTQSPIGTKVSKDAVAAVKHTAELLESLGHIVVEDTPKIDGMSLAKDFITTWFSQFSYMLHQIKQMSGATDDEFELDSLALAAFGAKTTAHEYIHNLNNWGIYVTQMNQFFDQYDLYLTPATASVAPKNGELATPKWQQPVIKALLKIGQAHYLAKGKLVEQIIRENLKWVPFTQLANITGLPAMSVPLYWNKDHLPIGSQFIAPFAREDLLFQLAGQLEQAQPWSKEYQSIVV
ncbi:amidase [Acinetobacter ursingii]|uniref:amidase n=1 Tax=Acinetobacter ursingii TaxID=108980 RepID=UPI00124C8F4F|nr:amidase family protein [Acinetobacter ursingii]MCU4304712.1 amidase [Acinetobacter ursingii]MCU4370717.1 amidase [Acinetobacter ursingii]MDG9991831.1 amidase family protein [Acinetobacter ursingii]MDH0205276.1 amidase family protein [Acinetobacter ursingii]